MTPNKTPNKDNIFILSSNTKKIKKIDLTPPKKDKLEKFITKTSSKKEKRNFIESLFEDTLRIHLNQNNCLNTMFSNKFKRTLCYTDKQISYMTHFMSKVIRKIKYKNIELNNNNKSNILAHGGVGFIYDLSNYHFNLCVKFIKTIFKNNEDDNDIYNNLNDDLFVKKILEVNYIINHDNNDDEYCIYKLYHNNNITIDENLFKICNYEDNYNKHINYLKNKFIDIELYYNKDLIIQIYEKADYSLDKITNITDELFNELLKLLDNFNKFSIEYYNKYNKYIFLTDVKNSNIVYFNDIQKFKFIDFESFLEINNFYIDKKTIKEYTQVFHNIIYNFNNNNNKLDYFTILYPILCLFITIFTIFNNSTLININNILSDLYNKFIIDKLDLYEEYFYNKFYNTLYSKILYKYSLLFFCHYNIYINQTNDITFYKCENGQISYININLSNNILQTIYEFYFL